MRFSIVVPIYNSLRYLEDCVHSVTAQSFSDWELILVDDGSTDGSGELADAIAEQDDRIRAIHQTNAGQFFARRAGIRQAQGKYVLFLDSDDLLIPDALSSIYALLEKEEWDLVLFLGRAFGPNVEHGESIGSLDAPAGEVELISIRRIVASSECLNSVCLKAFNRSLFINDEMDYQCLRNVRHGEDKAMLLHPLTRAQRCCYMPQELYLYRNNEESAMRNIVLDDVPSLLGNAVFSLVHQAMGAWGLVSRADECALGAYYLRNYIATYFNLRREYRSSDERRALRSYSWKSALDSRYLRLSYVWRLGPRETVKLICALLRV